MQLWRGCSSDFIKKLAIALTFCLPLAATAQVYGFRHFGLDKNVFPSRIECIKQAQTGKLYIGTLAGLVVYDGHAFRQFSVADGLSENAISAMGTHGSSVWVGHWAGSLSIINANTGGITAINLQQSLNFSSITSLVPCDDSVALIVTREGRLFQYADHSVEQVLISGKPVTSKVREVFTANGHVYVITDHAIYANADSTYTEWQKLHESNKEIVLARKVLGSEWLICHDFDITLVDIERGTSEVLHTTPTENLVVSVVQDQEEYLWIGTAEQGIIRYHPILKEKTFIKRENGLSYNQVRKLFLDREGTVWVATSAGLDQYLGNAFVLFDKRSGLPDNLVWDFIKTDNGFLTAAQAGLFLLEDFGAGTLPSRILQMDMGGAEPRKIYATANARVLYVVDASGGLWKGSLANGFHKLTAVTMDVRCLEEVNGEIWLGTDNGILKLADDRPVEHFTRETGLGGDRVNGIYYSKTNNETWITALGSPATLYHNGRFKLYGAEQGLTSNLIQDVAFDPNGNPWMATYDNGVLYLNDEGVFVPLSDKVTMQTSSTFAISIDQQQCVWIGHNWGLDRYRIPFEDLSSFTADDGFMGIEVNPGAIHSDGRGNVWMGTLMGILMFKPTDFRMNLTEPATRITLATVGGKDVMESGTVGQTSFAGSDLRVEFEGISLVNPASNRLEYRLVGIHESWRTTQLGTPVEYHSLASGDYRFEVRVCNNSGYCNPEPRFVEFSITPPFFKTWWFYTLLFFVIITGIYLMDRYRLLSLLDEKNALTAMLSEKEQQLIETEQEVEGLRAHKLYGLYVSEALTPDVLRGGKGVFHKAINTSTLSSDHVISLKHAGMELFALLDTGLADAAGAQMATSIRACFYERCQQTTVHTTEEMLSVLDTAVKNCTSALEKHKGVKWVVWHKQRGQYLFNLRGLPIYLLHTGEVSEIEGTSLNEGSFMAVEPAKNTRIVMATDGLFDLMADDGTRTFGKKRFAAKLRESANLPTIALLDNIEREAQRWRGGIEQHDDITLIIIEHEVDA